MTSQQNRLRCLTRRDLLRGLAGSLACTGLGRFADALSDSAFPFEAVPPSASGITWTHVNGKSPERFLPETTGAGAHSWTTTTTAGWTSIWSTAASATFTLPIRRCAMRSTAIIVTALSRTLPRKRELRAEAMARVLRLGIMTAMVFLICMSRSTAEASSITTTVTAPSPMLRRRRASPHRDGLPARSGSITTTMDTWTCSSASLWSSHKSLNKTCGSGEEGKHGYCIPRLYQPLPSWLFHNNGDGTFTDVSQASGIARYRGKAWGVVATDINNDGRMDLFVANDTVANFLFMNRGEGKFEEIGTPAGVAFSADGRSRSGMGVDSADYDQDGWMDLFVANIDQEIYSIYQNNHDETFDDRAEAHRDWHGHPVDERMGPEIFRLRQ